MLDFTFLHILHNHYNKMPALGGELSERKAGDYHTWL